VGRGTWDRATISDEGWRASQKIGRYDCQSVYLSVLFPPEVEEVSLLVGVQQRLIAAAEALLAPEGAHRGQAVQRLAAGRQARAD